MFLGCKCDCRRVHLGIMHQQMRSIKHAPKAHARQPFVAAKVCSSRCLASSRAGRVVAASGSSIPDEADVVIVGGGIAGLSCAMTLQQKGMKSLIVEASDGIGKCMLVD